MKALEKDDGYRFLADLIGDGLITAKGRCASKFNPIINYLFFLQYSFVGKGLIESFLTKPAFSKQIVSSQLRYMLQRCSNIRTHNIILVRTSNIRIHLLKN